MTKRQTPRANTSAWLEYRAFKTSSGARYPRVPTHVVFIRFWLGSSSFSAATWERPKSVIFNINLSVIKILFGFKSRCVI